MRLAGHGSVEKRSQDRARKSISLSTCMLLAVAGIVEIAIAFRDGFIGLSSKLGSIQKSLLFDRFRNLHRSSPFLPMVRPSSTLKVGMAFLGFMNRRCWCLSCGCYWRVRRGRRASSGGPYLGDSKSQSDLAFGEVFAQRRNSVQSVDATKKALRPDDSELALRLTSWSSGPRWRYADQML